MNWLVGFDGFAAHKSPTDAHAHCRAQRQAQAEQAATNEARLVDLEAALEDTIASCETLNDSLRLMLQLTKSLERRIAALERNPNPPIPQRVLPKVTSPPLGNQPWMG